MTTNNRRYFCSIKMLKNKGFSVNHGISPESLSVFNGFIQTQVTHSHTEVGPFLILESDSIRSMYRLHSLLEEVIELKGGPGTIKNLREMAKLIRNHPRGDAQHYNKIYIVEKDKIATPL